MVAKNNLRIDAYGICPEFPFDESRTLRGVGSIDEKVLHGRRFGHRVARTWLLTWDNTTKGQMWLLRQAFSAVGISGTMNFIPPDSEDGGIVEVRFTGPLEIEQMSATAWKATVTIEERLR